MEASLFVAYDAKLVNFDITDKEIFVKKSFRL